MLPTLYSIIYPYFGLAGSLVVIAAVIVSGLVYRGPHGERYSSLNHFISELGQVGISRAAGVFNYGLILAGILLLPYLVGLALVLNNVWAIPAAVAGAWATISCALIGFFPMNNIKAHIKAAMSYFRAGLVTMLLYSISIFAQPAESEIIPKGMIWIGVMASLVYAVFLKYPHRAAKQDTDMDVLDTSTLVERPKVWMAAVLEWAVLASTMLWFLATSLALLI